MPLNHSWRPEWIEEVVDRWVDVKLPVNENISAHEAERLMVTYLQIRDDWVDQFINATYYQKQCEFKRQGAYNLAFMRAEAKSDRQRDIVARQDPTFLMATAKEIEADAALLECKLKVESSTLAHHATKAIFNKASDEKFL